ncbi:GNAT family N-acetyltransferase [Streptomyces brasiliensis]|uniref:N-acetyltransferase n=1 Tax=Streptomyces brasiliensis TaxID=1954 RepID=A0A917KHL1_9ACTN|nr:GNAT family N-acetyltransferase [Streptomyces brasiliensis]GGJ13966.1 N-acetyltransferase [Streptomyces brasiliensis]
MEDLGFVAWPPEPIRTGRLVLREPEARDRAAFIDLLASPEVHSYLGGPRSRDELEREMSGAPERWPGNFVVDLDGSMIGQILLRRAKGHRRHALPGEPVVLTTQTANVGSMRLVAKLGFIEVERFEAWGAEQWLGMWSPATPSS